jgi:aromatic ring-cleaving dioxygenase
MNYAQYHFHLYFEPSQIKITESVISQLKELDNIEIGRIWNKPVGPHPIGSCQVTVQAEDFYKMTEWFLNNRQGLTIFIHALTGDDLKDHTDYVMWIGQSYKLNTDMFLS